MKIYDKILIHFHFNIKPNSCIFISIINIMNIKKRVKDGNVCCMPISSNT